LSIQELIGTWKGETTEMPQTVQSKKQKNSTSDPDKIQLNCTPTLKFSRTDGTRGGIIDISSDYTVTQEVASLESKIPVNATVGGTMTATGTWIIDHEDEVKLMLDPTKTKVDVDTTSLSLSYARLTDTSKDSLEVMRQRLLPNVSETVEAMVKQKISNLKELDDVTVTDNIMTLEIENCMLTFTKQ
ncbi:MAG: hypothetical protein K2K37_11360, partial [Muribaculaceae bacterium]|nr:hypothetical protein [Muribaculaceae bacterium]